MKDGRLPTSTDVSPNRVIAMRSDEQEREEGFLNRIKERFR